MPGPSPAATAFAREHHVRYEVTPEEIVQGGDRETVGFDVRVFASHERSALVTPGCAPCLELLDRLRGFAEEVVRRASRGPSPVQIVAEPGALYQSPDDSGKDDVSLTIRVGPLAPGARDDDPAVAGVVHELEASGVSRQG